MTDTIRLQMVGCLAGHPPSAEAVFQALLDAGGEFVSSFDVRTRVAPLGFLLADGATHPGLAYRHPLFSLDRKRRDELPPESADAPSGAADVSWLPESRSVLLKHAAWDLDPAAVDRLAGGLFNWFVTYRGPLRPVYAFIDWSGDNLVPLISLTPQTLPYLHWVNAFSPEFGADAVSRVLPATPPGQILRLEDGYLVHRSTPSLSHWLRTDVSALVPPLRRVYPIIERYRPREINPDSRLV